MYITCKMIGYCEAIGSHSSFLGLGKDNNSKNDNYSDDDDSNDDRNTNNAYSDINDHDTKYDNTHVTEWFCYVILAAITAFAIMISSLLVSLSL